MKLSVKQTIDVKYLSIALPVRYEDDDMPFDAPLRIANMWVATIILDEGRIKDWPQGSTLEFDMKVCDSGIYVLRDENCKEVARLEDYVPHGILPGDYGDYVELKIDGTGKITNWYDNPDLSDFENRDEE